MRFTDDRAFIRWKVFALGAILVGSMTLDGAAHQPPKEQPPKEQPQPRGPEPEADPCRAWVWVWENGILIRRRPRECTHAPQPVPTRSVVVPARVPVVVLTPGRHEPVIVQVPLMPYPQPTVQVLPTPDKPWNVGKRPRVTPKPTPRPTVRPSPKAQRTPQLMLPFGR